jgi:ABC-type branched-subunit amino acid transport system substrate-binding protein
MAWGSSRGSRTDLRAWVVVRRIAAVGLLVAMASGCGARWTDDQTQIVEARDTRGSDGASSGSNSEGVAGDSGQATTDEGAGEVATAGGGDGGSADGSSSAGSSGTTGGSGGTGGTGGRGPLPCAASSKAPGVSDGKIVVGNISTQSGPVPGLGQSAVAATRAYIAYLNSSGGVCGRQVEMKTADDGLDNGAFRAIITKMEPTVLGLVGMNGGGDAGGAQLVEEKHVPVVTAAFSTPFQNASTVFDMNPPFRDTSKSIGKYKWLRSQGVTKAALVYGDVAQSKDQIKNAEQPLIEAAGIKVVADLPQPLSTLNYDSAARSVANSKADYLLFLGAYEQNSNMAKSMKGTGYKGLKYSDIYTAYGTNFIDLAGSAADGTMSWAYYLPIEDGGKNPEQAKFIKWLKQTSPGAPADVFAAEAWASAKAFFDALQQLKGPITRDALLGQIRTYTSYDAAGFIGKVNLAGEANGGCQVGMQVVGGKWKRITPTSGFLC